jgi:hypothetical protein
MADNRPVDEEQSDGPSMSYLVSPPEPEPESPWRCSQRTMRIMLQFFAGAGILCFFLALGAWIWNHPQYFLGQKCSTRVRPSPEGFVCCDPYNGTNGCPIQPWPPAEHSKRDLQAVTLDFAAFDSEFIHIDLENGNAEPVGVDVQTTTDLAFVYSAIVESTVIDGVTPTPVVVSTTAESTIIAEAIPTPFAVPAPYMNAQQAMSQVEFASRHKGPTTTTNGFRSPSTTLTTFATSTRSATTIEATSLSSASTTATIEDVTSQATKLLHTQQLMSGYQSSHCDLMKGYIQNLNEALDIGDADGAIEVMGNMFIEMENYEIFLEGVVVGLDLEAV